MTVCDPLYGYMSFDEDERRLIDQKAFQRLRAVQQLGFSQYAFPSGSGNRFTHSLGACHLAGMAFDSVFSKKEAPRLSESKRRLFRKTLRFAALLHDIGHGPLSHSSECLMPPLSDLALEGFLNGAPQRRAPPKRRARHEDYSALLILKTNIAEIIKKAGLEPEAVVSLIHREAPQKTADFWMEGGLCFQTFLRQIISSDLDADRMDYLQRDSLFCGVKYGLMDFQWLLSHFTCQRDGDRLFLALRGEALYTVESFLLGRRHMRLIVYFHHKAVIYNQMLHKYAEHSLFRLPSDPGPYIDFTDSRLFETLKEEKGNEWSRRILEQRPFLRLFERDVTSHNRPKEKKEGERERDLKQALREAGIPFIEADSNQSAPPEEGISAGADRIFLKNSLTGAAEPLNESLLPLPARRIRRIYAAPEFFEEAKRILNGRGRGPDAVRQRAESP